MHRTADMNKIASFVFINSHVSKADFEWKLHVHAEVTDEIIAIHVLWLTQLCGVQVLVLPIWPLFLHPSLCCLRRVMIWETGIRDNLEIPLQMLCKCILKQ